MTPDRKEHWTVKATRLGFAVAALSSQVGCLSRGQKIGSVTPSPEGTKTTPTETVPPVTSPATEISPSSGVSETIVIAEQRYMSQQEVLAVDPSVESKFREFQEEIKANNPSATFTAWGALATAQTGETYFTPFFEVYNDGNLVSEYVNIGKIDGSIATIELKPGEVEGPDGKIYVSLSQTVNADTNELLETPLPYIWIPYSRAEYNALSGDEKAKVPVYFSAIPGIVPQNEAPSVYGGAKTENIRMIIATPEATPEDLNYSFSSAITPERFQVVMKSFSNQPDFVNNITEQKSRPVVVAGGHILSYELMNVNGEISMYVLFATTGGVLKAKIDYVIIAQGLWPQPQLPISELTQAQAVEISDYLNRVIYKLGTDSFSFADVGYVGMVAINSETEAENCRKDLVPLDNVNELCFYDSSLGKITPEEMEAKIRSAIASTKNKQPEEVLNFDSPNFLSIEGNAYIFLQIPVIQSP